MKIKVLLLLASMALIVFPCIDTSSCFIKKLFDFKYPVEDMYNVSLSSEAGSLDNMILGYGDFNNDLHAEYLAIDSATSTILVFLYENGGDFDGQYRVSFTWPLFKGCVPLNTYLYDVNLDIMLDISIWGQYANGTNCLYFLLQDSNNQFSSGLDTPNNYDATTQPILFESVLVMQGAKTTCLLLYDAQAKARKIVYFNISAYFQAAWNSTFNNSNENIPFSDQHWNSFIDLTGDCDSQIVITNANSQVEFWLYTKNKFILASTINLQAKLGIDQLTSLSFIDANYDGMQDLVLGTPSQILIYLSTVGTPGQFCGQDQTAFAYNLGNPFHVYSPLSCVIQPQNIHFGDLNIDGYPDMVLTCQSGTTNVLQVYQNNFNEQVGSFEVFTRFQSAFNSLINSKQLEVTRVSLFDILENGITDIIVTVGGGSTIVLYNNYLYQNYYYIKGFATNGATEDRGVQIPGATFYWLNSLGNSQRVAVYSQMFQSAYGAVPMPYVLTGLGRANNYVEKFTIGRLGLSKSWSPIIPNSQLALFSGSQTSSNWAIRIFIMPTDSIVYVLIVCIVILAVLGSVLIILKCRDKKQQNLLYGDYM